MNIVLFLQHNKGAEQWVEILSKIQSYYIHASAFSYMFFSVGTGVEF